MQMTMRRFFIAMVLLIVGLTSMPATASVTDPDSTGTIIYHIQASGIITVVQPEAMMKRLRGGAGVTERQVLNMGDPVTSASESAAATESTDAVSGTTKVAGYRVQVFSDNNARTAKNEARSKAQAISEEFSDFRTYVVYQSPYWRLKVGDFTTATEAENAADMIKKKFPSYAREVRVVRDRINR